MGQFSRGLIFGGAYYRRLVCCKNLRGLYSVGAYTRRGLFSEFYGISYIHRKTIFITIYFFKQP